MPLRTSTPDGFLAQSTIEPVAYVVTVPASAAPARASCCGYLTSAERNRSKGAQLAICAYKLADDPNVVLTVCPVSFSKAATRRGRTGCRSDAAAIVRIARMRC